MFWLVMGFGPSMVGRSSIFMLESSFGMDVLGWLQDSLGRDRLHIRGLLGMYKIECPRNARRSEDRRPFFGLVTPDYKD